MQVNRDIVAVPHLQFPIFIAISSELISSRLISVFVVVIIRIREISNSTQIKRRQNNCRGSVKMRPQTQTHSGRCGVNLKIVTLDFIFPCLFLLFNSSKVFCA